MIFLLGFFKQERSYSSEEEQVRVLVLQNKRKVVAKSFCQKSSKVLHVKKFSSLQNQLTPDWLVLCLGLGCWWMTVECSDKVHF